MRKALRLAERGRGRTSPNPMVGALVVDAEGVIVGRGSHEFAGGPHAEILALAEAGERARGATLYCTLEPCSHHGRTGPCAPRVYEAGIGRVVTATEDPNPLVAGTGHAWLRARDVEVSCGLLSDAAAELNAPFFTVMREQRPHVTMKVAMSLDGRIAAAAGARTPLTGTQASRHVHRLRAEVDAIAIGSGTLASDDPLLTPRVAYRARPLTRVVFDRRLQMLPAARLLTTLDAGPVIVATSGRNAERNRDAAAALRQAGASLLEVEETGTPLAVLRALAKLGIGSLVVEGGAALHRAFWNAGLVDQVQIYVAPRILGPQGVDWIPDSILSSTRLSGRTSRQLGDDVLIEAYVHRTH